MAAVPAAKTQMRAVDSSSVTDFILQRTQPQIVNTHTHCTGLITVTCNMHTNVYSTKHRANEAEVIITNGKVRYV